MRKFAISLLAAVLLTCTFTGVAFAQEVLFEARTREELSRGVVYERNRMMTSGGMLDVHVITVDLNQPHVYIEPVTTSGNFGRRDFTSSILADAGAIGGINADFFGMAGAYSVHFGPMVRDGEVVALNTSTNYNRNEFATFFLDLQNNANFVYMQSDIRFYNNGVRNLTEIAAFNNIGHNFYWPVIVDSQTMYDTFALDARFPFLSKIVVENGLITFVSMPGETVDVPENGYVLILPERMHASRNMFRAGETARLEFRNSMNVDFSRIQAAVGGGAIILEGGEIVAGAGVAPNARHPRTAVGVNHTTGQLVLMVVDGRSHSIGATHADMAAIMRRYGATDAMHFDGGGSTTMSLQRPDGRHNVVNTPSDGGQRRVINAIGVFDRAPHGDILRVTLEMEETRAVVGVPLNAGVFGRDSFSNRIPLDPAVETIFIAESEECGFWRDGMYTPLRTGRHNLEVQHGAFRATASIYAYSLAQLQINPAELILLEGDEISLSFSGVATCGAPVPVPNVIGLSITPAYLGSFQNGEFTAQRAGAGFIAASVGSVRAYIPVSIGGFPRAVDWSGSRHVFLGYPAYVVGNVRPDNMNNRRVARLEYLLVRSSNNQGAYMTFDPPVAIQGEPIALTLEVYGDGSGHWLRGRVRDADGRNHLVDFSHSVDFVGWETVTARLPNATAPFVIDRIYMISQASYDVSHHMVAFYGLQALYAPPFAPSIPEGTAFEDRTRAARGFPGVTGRTYQFPIPAANATYNATGMSNFAAITITARGGSIASANRSQWSYFMPDIRRINPAYVVILLDYNPLNFRSQMELELFHLGLQELLAEGRQIFVVSATGDPAEPATLNMRGGIRYINMPSNATGISFLVDGDRILWSE
ncbi:MAG: phosphodiester glycosidase family protein [Defluviitaleaceae bacterium]|nr:phosphodiester glycosidase family protein [Defluviitaleaceae bacterium]